MNRNLLGTPLLEKAAHQTAPGLVRPDSETNC